MKDLLAVYYSPLLGRWQQTVRPALRKRSEIWWRDVVMRDCELMTTTRRRLCRAEREQKPREASNDGVWGLRRKTHWIECGIERGREYRDNIYEGDLIMCVLRGDRDVFSVGNLYKDAWHKFRWSSIWKHPFPIYGLQSTNAWQSIDLSRYILDEPCKINSIVVFRSGSLSLMQMRLRYAPV